MKKYLLIFIFASISLCVFGGVYSANNSTQSGYDADEIMNVTNPYGATFSAGVINKLDTVIKRLEQRKDSMNSTDFNRLLTAFEGKLDRINNKYQNKEIIQLLVSYLKFEVEKLYVDTDLEDFFCELEGSCNESDISNKESSNQIKGDAKIGENVTPSITDSTNEVFDVTTTVRSVSIGDTLSVKYNIGGVYSMCTGHVKKSTGGTQYIKKTSIFFAESDGDARIGDFSKRVTSDLVLEGKINFYFDCHNSVTKKVFRKTFELPIVAKKHEGTVDPKSNGEKEDFTLYQDEINFTSSLDEVNIGDTLAIKYKIGGLYSLCNGYIQDSRGRSQTILGKATIFNIINGDSRIGLVSKKITSDLISEGKINFFFECYNQKAKNMKRTWLKVPFVKTLSQNEVNSVINKKGRDRQNDIIDMLLRFEIQGYVGLRTKFATSLGITTDALNKLIEKETGEKQTIRSCPLHDDKPAPSGCGYSFKNENGCLIRTLTCNSSPDNLYLKMNRSSVDLGSIVSLNYDIGPNYTQCSTNQTMRFTDSALGKTRFSDILYVSNGQYLQKGQATLSIGEKFIKEPNITITCMHKDGISKKQVKTYNFQVSYSQVTMNNYLDMTFLSLPEAIEAIRKLESQGYVNLRNKAAKSLGISRDQIDDLMENK